MNPDPILRAGTYHLRRRVPKRFATIEDRAEVWISLKTDSLTLARSRADSAWQGMITAWEARLAGDVAEGDQRMEAARQMAKAHGFRYLPVEKVARLPIEDLLARIEATYRAGGKIDKVRMESFLGLTEPAKITLSTCLDIFMDVTKDKQEDMTANQLRVWSNHRRQAIAVMIEAMGDLDLSEIGPDELFDLRDHLWSQIKAGQIQRDTANKRMGIGFTIIRTVNRARRMGLSLDFSGMRFSDAEQNTRLPFSDEWIRTKILAPGALDGLNLEARGILLGMINTGYRPSEGAELRAEDIRLDTDVPHISIHGRHRKLKTRHSERMIPLTGVSLEAFRACPGGFPRYQDSASLTAVVNRYLRENGLRETEKHSFYGLRHSFEDRMLEHDVDERIRRDLMGHKLEGRERYGAGARLEKLHEILLPMAL